MASAKTLSAAGAGLGTSAPAPAFIGASECDENAGTIGFGTGTSPAPGLLFTITFGGNYTDPVQSITPRVTVIPVGSNVAAMQIYAIATPRKVDFYAAVASPGVSQPANTYFMNYKIDL